MRELREHTDSLTLIDAAPATIARHLDFDLVVVSEISGRAWQPTAAYVRGDPQAAADIRARIDPPRQLHPKLDEADSARRRRPILVDRCENNPGIGMASSYVAAPLAPAGETIGFLHADRHLSAAPLQAFDRGLLAAFAEAFGQLLRSLALTRLLQDQRATALRDTRALTEHLLAVDGSHISLTPTARLHPARLDAEPIDSRLYDLLTTRQIEIVRLLASGKSNSQIAAQLVIAEGTVKSHVKHIFRRLHATNRAEVVAKYMRLTSLPLRSAG